VRRILLVSVFLVLASAVFLGGHFYIADRLVLDVGLAQPWRALALGLIAGGALCIAAEPVAARRFSRARARLVAWPASLWMGFAFLLIVVLGASDLVLWLTGGAAQAATGSGAPAALAGPRAAIVLGFTAAVAAFAVRTALAGPELRRVELFPERWPRSLDGFRIVQVSDIHIGALTGRAFARELTERVNALSPDLVAVTGDLVDGPVEHLGEEVAPFGELRGRCGVYFVTGNHDHYSGARSWCDRMRELGLRVLRNERVRIGSGDAAFDLAGVDDHRGDMVGADGGEDLDRALAGRDESVPLLLLAHDPTTFKRASQRGVDLQLSGHTHGGQIWPFGYIVRLAMPWVAGPYREGASQIYVSRGTGFWGPPMRLFAPAEITELVLRAQ